IDVAIIGSGDGDFVGLVDAAQRAGLRVEVAATPRQTSTDLIDVADRFIDLEVNARTYARAELPPRPYGHTTGSLGRSPNRPTFGTGSLGDRGPLPMREQQEGNEGQRSFEPQRPYPATPQSAPLPSQARASGEEETAYNASRRISSIAAFGRLALVLRCSACSAAASSASGVNCSSTLSRAKNF